MISYSDTLHHQSLSGNSHAGACVSCTAHGTFKLYEPSMCFDIGRLRNTIKHITYIKRRSLITHHLNGGMSPSNILRQKFQYIDVKCTVNV